MRNVERAQPDWDEIRVKVELVREARTLFGRRAAARLWRSLDLPAHSVSSVTPATKHAEHVRRFIAEATIYDPGNVVQASVLKSTYDDWVKVSGAPMMTAKAFAMCLTLLGWDKRASSRIYYLNLRLRRLTDAR